MSAPWGPWCAKCGHPSSYHGVSFCCCIVGSDTKRACDCDGYSPTTEARPQESG